MTATGYNPYSCKVVMVAATGYYPYSCQVVMVGIGIVTSSSHHTTWLE